MLDLVDDDKWAMVVFFSNALILTLAGVVRAENAREIST